APASRSALRYVQLPSGIRFTIPVRYPDGLLILRDAAGREACRVETRGKSEVTVPYKKGGNAVARAGIYFASLHYAGGRTGYQPVVFMR
ncbi:MAG: hypothetical protein JXA71_19640, partial [Chitinispirillaceae bacterium]|nr:hypothetical protein [Chitinispirillaceae bacterium]